MQQLIPLEPIPTPLVFLSKYQFIILESLPKYPEKELIERLKNDDVKAFKLIFTSFYKPLLRYAMKYVMDLDAAEDIVQQIYVYIWEKRKTNNIKHALQSYLFRSVHNACINHLKQNDRKKDYIKNFLVEVNKGYNVNGLTELIDFELMNEIEDAVSDLPENCQYIFRLSRFDGLGNKEIADQLSISIRTVETQIYRAMKFMKKRLKEYAPITPVLVYYFFLL